MNKAINNLLLEQTATWETARNNYAALSGVQVKELSVNGIPYKVQFNPARIVSSGAKVDAKSIQERKCFLCPANLPPAQKGVLFKEHYNILVNPFPIFPRHLTIPETEHVDQRIAARFGDMLDLAQALTEYTIFYNGPRCGASAPDHAHFQAGNKDFLPIEQDWREQVAGKVINDEKASLFYLNDAPRTTLVIEAAEKRAAMKLFDIVYHSMTVKPGEEEPMMNVLAMYEHFKWIVFIFPRALHRPACYTAQGEANLLSSPASVDLGGVFITPVEKDFVKITAKDIAQILSEVCLSEADFDRLKQRIKEQKEERDKLMEEPKVQVGILFEPQIEFILPTPYRAYGDHEGMEFRATAEGKQVVTYYKDRVFWNDHCFKELRFEPLCEETDAFELLDVTIGINFHWERKENQRFLGALKIIVEDGKLTGINVIHVEDYLTSVISSEMSATASLELLKAHAVISRSWLLAQIQKNKEIEAAQTGYSAMTQTDEELIRWYDREDHTRFDVCADDHCQRYQGITRASTEIVKQAIAATRGQVLTSDGKICDARFSKCCGGAFEEFQYCWEDVKYPYLQKQRDFKVESGKVKGENAVQYPLPDLTKEDEADRWIRTSPEAFCNTTDKKILSQVLNNYDQETTDFYRWKVAYTQDELSTLILKRSGIDYGQIIDLIPIARGTSARLWKLKIVGTKKTLTIGKELEIRRTLSNSHLYSSAFVVDKEDVSPEGIPGRFILTGAGWGHGAGLCQIGAAVMGEQGYKYDTILLHYYIGANVDKLYD